ncbi:MAG: sigma-70 family RNA polymerase sigma factor [Fibrobacterales bacterium]
MKSKATFEKLYTQYSPMVYRRCFSMLKNEEMAADCMHDTFLTVHNKGEALDVSQPSSLLYTMATNRALNMIRDSKVKCEEPALELIADAQCTLTLVNDKSFLKKVLSRNDEKSAAMAVMHYRDGWSVGEVAGYFKISIPAVRKRLKKLQKFSREAFTYEV